MHAPPAAAAAPAFLTSARPGACLLSHAGTLVRATALVPDVDGVRARAWLATAVITGPALLLLLALASSRGSRRRTTLVAPALRVAVLAAGCSAIACWRLLWAHRIDLLREARVADWRVADNQLGALLLGAALAGLAASALAEHELPHRRSHLRFALAGWLLWLLGAALASRVAPGLLELTSGDGAASVGALAAHYAARSSAYASGPLLLAASALTACAPALWRRLAATAWRRHLPPATMLGLLAAAALAGKLLAPRMVLLKLGLAYAIVIVGHAALRIALCAEAPRARRVLCTVATATAAAAMLMLDSGVALAITGVGLVGAMVMAGHDAMYSDAAAPRLGLLEREHASILATYGIAAAALAVAMVGWGLVASDRLLIEHTAALVLHTPLAIAALFSLGAVLARRHRQPWAAWLAAALAALALWGVRQPAIERVMAGRGVSAQRVSAVVDPGYALLRDQRRFMASTSAWQAASLPVDEDPSSSDPAAGAPGEPAAPSAAARWQGQGLFGSRVTDPGVSRSIDNDYLPILIARELGVLGLMRTTLLLLGLLLAVGALAGARLPHASAAARTRSLVLAVAGALCVYQPLAALGILPLTGISWPGLGVDSPADLWIACFGLTWCLFGASWPGERADGRSAAAVPASERHRLPPPSDDERIRATPRLRRARTLAALALSGCGLAGVAMVARAGDSALGRGALAQPHHGSGDVRLDRAIAYARTLACGATSGSGLPSLVGTPSDETTARFHRQLLAEWQAHRQALLQQWDLTGGASAPPASPTASAQPAAPSAQRAAPSTQPAAPSAEPAVPATEPDPEVVRAPWLARCHGRLQRWRFERLPDGACRATFDAGWPQVRLELRPAPSPAAPSPASASTPASPAAPAPGHPATAAMVRATCHIDLPADPIALLMPPSPAAPQRIRLVSRALGDAAADLGEVLIDGAVVRLRRGAPAIDLSGSPSSTTLSVGLHHAGRLQLGPTTALELDGDAVYLRGRAQTWISNASGHGPTWTPSAPATLDRITLVVSDGATPRTVLFRPRRAWSSPTGGAGAAGSSLAPSSPAVVDPAVVDPAVVDPAVGDPAVVDPLLADDLLAVSDRARRSYPYGNTLPVLGWVNPFSVERSLGLDGWVHAALAPSAPSGATAPSPGAASGTTTCGTLAPQAIRREAVCSPSPLDGVLECRVSLQPELTLALAAQVTGLLRDPRSFTGKDVTPLRAAFVLLRGDTGELLAHGDTTWRRAASAYAPRTAAEELRLVRLREDRDPLTGAPGEPGESEAERVDWNLPIAVGSTLKPVVARAAELALPTLSEQLVLGYSGSQAQCRGRRGAAGFAAILGHCPPTSLTSEPATSDLHDFLARSPNWFQAALGLLGLGLPDGGFATGDRSRGFLELMTSDLSTWSVDEPLMIRDADGPILGKRGVILEGLRRTPLWRAIERVLGRPLCTLGDRKSCVAAASRRDLCAARALPIANPGADLRQLVALGPDRFDFYGDDRRQQTTVPTREYLQWLRGSGVHPSGSLAQLTDAFARVIYEPDAPGPLPEQAPTGGRLAASWFPAPAVGAMPSWRCASVAPGRAPKVRGADGGLCAVLAEGGTAHAALAGLFRDSRLILYGAKTGTIDSLATIARKRSSCESWNRAHTLPDRPAELASQPGWLACGRAPADDSLLVLSFSVTTGAGAATRTVPLTLGLALQRAGKGSAARLAPHLIATIADYFDDSH